MVYSSSVDFAEPHQTVNTGQVLTGKKNWLNRKRRHLWFCFAGFDPASKLSFMNLIIGLQVLNLLKCLNQGWRGFWTSSKYKVMQMSKKCLSLRFCGRHTNVVISASLVSFGSNVYRVQTNLMVLRKLTIASWLKEGTFFQILSNKKVPLHLSCIRSYRPYMHVCICFFIWSQFHCVCTF